jgi:hypothetical protein
MQSQQRPALYSTDQNSSAKVFIGKPIPRPNRLLSKDTYRTSGVGGLISKQRGRPSNRRKPEAVRTEALAIIGKRYADFGPTLAAACLS